jgi:hypothetical protein
VFFITYVALFKRDTRFRQLRFFLVLSLIVSVVLPLAQIEINLNAGIFSQTGMQESFLSSDKEQNNQLIHQEGLLTERPIGETVNKFNSVDWNLYISIGYSLIALVFLFRFFIRVFLTIKLYNQSRKKKHSEYTLVLNNQIQHSFSFFRWIFIPSTLNNKNEINQIITHEKIHVKQSHSFDIILIELIAAVFWFNPVIWMMRREVQLVHEYLADEGALSTGIDRLRYQALLVNQVAEERFILLSSSFNHSLIKKRMIMMTKSEFNRGTKLKILAVIPLSIILFLGVGCVNGQKSNNENVVAAISPTRMNVMYLGVDNPVKIAVSGYKTSEIEVSVPENGKITGTNGNYVVRPEKPGNLFIEVMHKNKVIQKTEFRVKPIPDPVAAVMAGNKAISNGTITKNDLLNAGGIVVHMRNFDFDLQFKIESFVLSIAVPNSTTVREEISESNMFSSNQVGLIKSLVKNQKLIVENIIAVGPDGFKRKLSPMVLNISE